MGTSFGGGGRELDLSNGATDVFLSVLQFALSDLAATGWERELAQWVGWHDQNLAGRGTVGFDLAEVRWTPADFAAQRGFLLRCVDTALTGYRWGELCYDPPHAHGYLRDYRAVVAGFGLPAGSAGVGPARGGYGWPGPADPELRCPRHGVHCSEYGWCRICADCGTDHA